MADKKIRGVDILKKNRAEILSQWLAELQSDLDGTNAGKQREQAERLLNLVVTAAERSSGLEMSGPEWKPVVDALEALSAERARGGFTSSQTATFVFSLKQPVFAALRKEIHDVSALGDATWEISSFLDRLGLLTVEAFQRAKEGVILRQQEDMLELSTPVVRLWDGILALPMIGTLDSARSQVVMESLLQRIVETGAEIAILDITGVPTVDTLVAQHLLKTVTAIRLMGSDCIISGLRPQIAQTIVHLGVNLSGITTKATLADALALALERTGRTVVSRKTD